MWSYGKHATSRPTILKRGEQFENFCTEITDDYCSVRSATSTNAETFTVVKKFYGETDRWKLRECRVFWLFHIKVCIPWFTNTCNIENCVRGSCHGFWRLYTKNNTDSPVSIFCNNMMQKVTNSFCIILPVPLSEMSSGTLRYLKVN